MKNLRWIGLAIMLFVAIEFCVDSYSINNYDSLKAWSVVVLMDILLMLKQCRIEELENGMEELGKAIQKLLEKYKNKI